MSGETANVKLGAFASEKTGNVLADGHPVVRQTLRTRLEKQFDFDVVAGACDGEKAATIRRRTKSQCGN